MRRILLVLGILLVMTGSAYGFDLEKACGDFAALRSPDTKVYRGEWRRTFPREGSPQKTAFVVLETTGRDRVLLFYVVERRNGRARCVPMFGSRSGKTLKAQTPWRGTTLEYTFDGEGGATAMFVRKDRAGTVTFESEGKLRLAK